MPFQQSSPSPSRRRFLLTMGAGITGVAMGCRPSSSFFDASSQRASLPSSSSDGFPSRTGQALGTTVRISIGSSNSGPDCSLALDQAFALIDELEDLLSIYRPQSQISRLNSTGVLQDADPRLLEVLTTARGVSEQSAGAFDVTIQPLWDLFASAQEKGRLPGEHELAQVLPLIDYRQIEQTGATIRLHDSTGSTNETATAEVGQPLRLGVTLNGIAQGYVLDQVRAQLQDNGVVDALIDTGELGTLGEGRRGRWRLGIQHPDDPAALAARCAADGRCMATSGGYATRFTADGVHHHLLDPRTGRSPLALASATVVAPSGILADAMSTAIFVMSIEEGLKLIDSMPDTDAYLITRTTPRRVLKTRGFPLAAATT